MEARVGKTDIQQYNSLAKADPVYRQGVDALLDQEVYFMSRKGLSTGEIVGGIGITYSIIERSYQRIGRKLYGPLAEEAWNLHVSGRTDSQIKSALQIGRFSYSEAIQARFNLEDIVSRGFRRKIEAGEISQDEILAFEEQILTIRNSSPYYRPSNSVIAARLGRHPGEVKTIIETIEQKEKQKREAELAQWKEEQARLDALQVRTEEDLEEPYDLEFPKRGGLLGDLFTGKVNPLNLEAQSTIEGVERMEDLDYLNRVVRNSVRDTRGISSKYPVESVNASVRAFLESHRFIGPVSEMNLTVVLNNLAAPIPTSRSAVLKLFSYLFEAKPRSNMIDLDATYVGEVILFVRAGKNPVLEVRVKHLMGKEGVRELEVLLDESRSVWAASRRAALMRVVSAGLPSLGKRR